MNIAARSIAKVSAPPHVHICNLLQVAASALHLLDLTLDDELRPLARAGLTAIREAAASVPAVNTSPTNMRIS